ncbi:hypothetical protein MGG_16704 [Pyricularia oryzae 70-15]|uniref:Uncharacterized protein n=3 Tax=Pyricularia oryzae TaxID=318829 RepID=G4N3P1_PYRO7|nr:uncharacterized protein MGG_16704 [Pyricularia oryzae 70-15]EHA51865.1 hypothetical protein MGG_16704 [Pyricularia oryzae 70-15]ELQ34065.1 hypothetical protein OOU_Y34scaffold00807g3 [Pyricularia oryzae Y34]
MTVYQVAAVHIRDAKTHPRGPAWAQVGGAGCPWWVNTFVRGARARPTVWARAFLAARGPPSTRQENPWATPGPRADPAGWWAGPGCLYFRALADMRCTSSSDGSAERGIGNDLVAETEDIDSLLKPHREPSRPGTRPCFIAIVRHPDVVAKGDVGCRRTSGRIRRPAQAVDETLPDRSPLVWSLLS